MSPPLVKVCVLGSSAVGKSTLIQQFVENHFEETHQPTAPRGSSIRHSSCSLNGQLYHFKLVDMPAIKEFPATSLAEWTHFQQVVLHTADAYLFVFDLNTPATFNYVKGKGTLGWFTRTAARSNISFFRQQFYATNFLIVAICRMYPFG